VRSVKLVELIVDKNRKVFVVYYKLCKTLDRRGKTF